MLTLTCVDHEYNIFNLLDELKWEKFIIHNTIFCKNVHLKVFVTTLYSVKHIKWLIQKKGDGGSIEVFY